MFMKVIKLVHTCIWMLMSVSVLYVFYSGITGRVNLWSWIGVFLVVIEGLALVLGKGDCPIHIYAQQKTGEKILNDTFLPQWIFFKGYKIVFSAFFLIGWLMMVINS